MKRYTISLAAAMMIAGSAVFAQTMTADDAIARLRSDNADMAFSRFEVRTGLTQIKVEAYSGNQKIEVIYDKSTGNVLKSETETVGIDDDLDDLDDDLDDLDDDRDDSDDDSSDDNDDDSNDDKGGDRDRSDDSNDDDSNDDNGNDDSSDD